MKKRFHDMTKFWRLLNGAILVGIVGLIMFEIHLVGSAQSEPVQESRRIAQAESGADQSADEGADDVAEADRVAICHERIKDFAEAQRNEFGKFMNEHFAQPKPTSELIEESIKKYREYREVLNQKVKSYGREGGNATLDSLYRDMGGCPQALATEFQLLEAMMREHILKNAYGKKSLILVKKYQALNEQLEKLNFSIADVYANFGRFSQKLPCFTKKCTQG